MPQGGFGRDYQQVTLLQNRAAEKQMEIQREKIGSEVLNKIESRLQKEIKLMEDKVIEKYEDSLHEMSETIKEKDKTLWFLIRVSYACLFLFSGLLGYSMSGLF